MSIDTNNPVVGVILTGGVGSRLWPLSRAQYPKPFNKLVGDLTLFQHTAKRINNIVDDIIIVCGETHRFTVTDQLKQIDIHASRIILEPSQRNTAPAAALAAIQSLKQHDNPLILLLPADHWIADQAAFEQTITVAKEQAIHNKMILFGCTPTEAKTGYGYIKAQQPAHAPHIHNVEQFVEKPCKQDAENYIQQKNYYWNSGIFMMRAAQYLEELNQFAPDITTLSQKAMSHAHTDQQFIRPDKTLFLRCRNDSIDYAVMERTKNCMLITTCMGWSDLGDWQTLYDRSAKDKQGNAISGDVVLEQTQNCYINANNRLVAAVGIEDCTIVETRDAILVAKNNCSNQLKHLVNQLSNKQRSQTQHHATVYRPWGHYTSLENEAGFQVKKISVNPGASLSLQKHQHRSEHWVVIEGTATVTCDEKVFELSKNQSTYIPKESIHRIENKTNDLITIIEIQVGSYLGEDDIIRYEDVYNRLENIGSH
ncbi:MAG: mannose-1-phosphate guanylyltransferase/mannose-6-phosphate isomerase [Gammaproteobacteria bacterium]|nr:mannose-1-phosphate guanylyltransferase/mannose-6-phosphate isomerase [Gammaproteobacteria bacterium]MCH9743891.1 mannose-1-phosphate guanylyltransferase/mannose-6-phosphate isomerase [Gammaproteobacteria bacterium]